MASLSESETEPFLSQAQRVREEIRARFLSSHQLLNEREAALLSELDQLVASYEWKEVRSQIQQLSTSKESIMSLLKGNESHEALELSIAPLNTRIRELKASLESAEARMGGVELEWNEQLEKKLSGMGGIRIIGKLDYKKKGEPVRAFCRHSLDHGGGRDDDSGSGRSFGGRRNDDSGGGRSFGGRRNDDAGGGRSFGGRRDDDAGGGRSFGGRRDDDAGGRRSFGGRRDDDARGGRSFGGRRDDDARGGRSFGGRRDDDAGGRRGEFGGGRIGFRRDDDARGGRSFGGRRDDDARGGRSFGGRRDDDAGGRRGEFGGGRIGFRRDDGDSGRRGGRNFGGRTDEAPRDGRGFDRRKVDDFGGRGFVGKRDFDSGGGCGSFGGRRDFSRRNVGGFGDGDRGVNRGRGFPEGRGGSGFGRDRDYENGDGGCRGGFRSYRGRGSAPNIIQKIVQVEALEKREQLAEILRHKPEDKVLVFVGTKRQANFLTTFLTEENFLTTSIHGKRQQREALYAFDAEKKTVLVATSYAARGLDIPKVNHVVNFDMPTDISEYVNRISMTGRIGHTGLATSFFDISKDTPIARSLVKILSDAKQDVPTFLEEIAESAIGAGYGAAGWNFGGTDRRQGEGGGGGNFERGSGRFGGQSFWDPINTGFNSSVPPTAGDDESWDDESWD